jgi:hypothetical protein
MRTNRRWLASITAFLSLALTCSTGCQTWKDVAAPHNPMIYEPDPACPLPRSLASQEDPEGAARRAVGVVTPAEPGRP